MGQEEGELVENGQSVQMSSYKINKSHRGVVCTARGVYAHCCKIHFEVKRGDHHKEKKYFFSFSLFFLHLHEMADIN